jgi:hypothetical protein
LIGLQAMPTGSWIQLALPASAPGLILADGRANSTRPSVSRFLASCGPRRYARVSPSTSANPRPDGMVRSNASASPPHQQQHRFHGGAPPPISAPAVAVAMGPRSCATGRNRSGLRPGCIDSVSRSGESRRKNSADPRMLT